MTAAATLTEAMTEDQLQASVIAVAEAHGWMWHHETDSRRTRAGWPDLVLVKGNRIKIIELKSEKGKASPEQQAWLDALADVDTISTGIVRPSDFDALRRSLASD